MLYPPSTGEDNEEPGPAAHRLRTVPGQEGARDQVHRPPDPGGSPQGHTRYLYLRTVVSIAKPRP